MIGWLPQGRSRPPACISTSPPRIVQASYNPSPSRQFTRCNTISRYPAKLRTTGRKIWGTVRYIKGNKDIKKYLAHGRLQLSWNSGLFFDPFAVFHHSSSSTFVLPHLLIVYSISRNCMRIRVGMNKSPTTSDFPVSLNATTKKYKLHVLETNGQRYGSTWSSINRGTEIQNKLI